MTGGSGVQAATITVPTVSVPVTYTAPGSTLNYDFSIPGFDTSLGTLTGVNIQLMQSVDSSTIAWTLENIGATTVSGFSAFTEQYQLRLLRPDTSASLRSTTGSGSATFGFSLAPGAQTTVLGHGSSGGGSGNVSSTHRSYFNAGPGGGDIDLRLQTIGADLFLASGLTIVSQGGTVESTATVDIRYTYTSSNTTPPPATPIAISSNTTGTLAAGEIDWFRFDYLTGALTIDTIGSGLTPTNDTFIALFNSTGTRVGQSDDATGLGRLSRLNLADGVLSPGTYYLAVAGWGPNTAFRQGFDVASNSSETGTYQVNLTGTPIPEPAAAALLLLPALGLVGRAERRRCP